MLIRILSLPLLASLLFSQTLFADNQAQSHAQTHEFQLRNGMKVIVKEDHRAPIVVSQIWYKVGSSYEHSGITGVSHVLEHMMFKGTKKYPAGEFSRIISINGGRENAFTGQDYTAYFQQLEKSRLAISFKLEADRMRNLKLTAEEFAKEVKVVMEERRLRTDDDPQSLLYEQFSASAFVSSPYHHPVIGWMEDLKNMQVDDLQQWYQQWYAPNNATLVVSGDIDPLEVKKLAKKYFGRIKPAKIRPLKPSKDVPQQGPKRLQLKAAAQVPYLIMGYKVPVLKTASEDWEPYALEVLAGILDGGNSSRISKNLIRGQQVASSASAGYSMMSRLDDMFIFDGAPTPTSGIKAVETALRQQITLLRDEPVSNDELQRVKAQVIAADVYGRDSVFYQAMKIGMMETVGLDWRLIDSYVEKVRAVTAAQVQAVAKKYLHDDNLTVAVLEPLSDDSKNAAPMRHHGGTHGH